MSRHGGADHRGISLVGSEPAQLLPNRGGPHPLRPDRFGRSLWLPGCGRALRARLLHRHARRRDRTARQAGVTLRHLSRHDRRQDPDRGPAGRPCGGPSGSGLDGGGDDRPRTSGDGAARQCGFLSSHTPPGSWLVAPIGPFTVAVWGLLIAVIWTVGSGAEYIREAIPLLTHPSRHIPDVLGKAVDDP